MAANLDPLDRLKLHFVWIAAELLGRYRGLLHVLDRQGLGNAEALEREVDAWVYPRMEEFARELKAKLDQIDNPTDEEP